MSAPPPPPSSVSTPGTPPSQSQPPPPSSSDPPPPSSTPPPPPPSSSEPTSTPTSQPTSAPPTSEPPSQPTSQPPTSQEPPPSPTTTEQQLPSSTSTLIITSGNETQTQIIVISQSVATSRSTASATASPDRSFFDNTGAVAGTFTAVGLVALGAAIFLVLFFLKKRRQKKFDREVDEAAFEAASAPAPTFLDDDDDAYTTGPRSNYTGPASNYYPTSETGSHGTYAQQPMNAETYGMTEMNNLNRHTSVGPGQIFNSQDAYATGAAGAAGIGVTRTRSMAGNAHPEQSGYGLDQGNSPYAAFAGPGHTTQSPHQAYGGYGGEAYAAANLNRGPSGTSSYNPYSSPHEAVPPLPVGAHMNRSTSDPASLVNPYDHQAASPPGDLVNPYGSTGSPPVAQQHFANPHSAGVEDQPQPTQVAGRVFSGGDFGGGSTPEFGQAPIHMAQTAEQGRWSDYNDDDNRSPTDEGPVPRLPRRGGESDSEEEEEERPKVFKVTN